MDVKIQNDCSLIIASRGWYLYLKCMRKGDVSSSRLGKRSFAAPGLLGIFEGKIVTHCRLSFTARQKIFVAMQGGPAPGV